MRLYFLGGHEQAVHALESNLNLKIDDYATFNWKAVVDAINVLGSVDMEISDKDLPTSIPLSQKP